MHEAREAAAQEAWRFCLQHPVLDLEAIRELVRRIEPILASGWHSATGDDTIVNPDLSGWSLGDRAEGPSCEFPPVREIELGDEER